MSNLFPGAADAAVPGGTPLWENHGNEVRHPYMTGTGREGPHRPLPMGWGQLTRRRLFCSLR